MTNKTYDKIYTVTSIHHLIPVKLDLAKLNYAHWKKVFTKHCAGFDVLNFITGTSTSEEKTSPEWVKADAVVTTWIFNTISEPLLERVLNSKIATAHDAWVFLEKIFHDNKLSKTMELNAELRALDIGSLTVEEYFRKIDRIATHLRNLGSKVEDSDLVMFAVNGLNDKYVQAKHIILHRHPFPDLDTTRSMLLMEEMTINRSTRTHVAPLNPSNPSALTVQVTNTPAKNSSKQELCHNFLRGFCRFESKCQYLHQGTNRRFNNSSSSVTQNSRAPGLNQAQLLQIISAKQQQLRAQSVTPNYPRPNLSPQSTAFIGYGPGYSRTQAQNGLLPTPLGFGQAHHTTPHYATVQQNNPLPSTAQQSHPGSSATHAQPNGPNAFFAAPMTYGSFTVDPQTQTQETVLPSAFSAMTLQDYGAAGWHMDTGASNHLTSYINNLSTVFNNCRYSSVAVGDGKTIHVTNTGHSLLPNTHRPLHLNNVLVTPNIVKNLISVRQFTRDNLVSVEFDPFGFSVKDFQTRRLLLRCDSTGDLYPVTTPTSHSSQVALLTSPITWHQRLGHPGHDVFRRLISNKDIICNKTTSHVLCHACQLGKHVRLPFSVSSTTVNSAFDIIHSDLWTSPVSSLSGLKYYIIFLDHYSHYVWVFPLRNKSDALNTFIQFRAFIRTQFKQEIKAFQCDNGGEFDNTAFHQLLQTNGIQFRFSYPHTSQQNGKSELMVRTINNLIRTFLFQAHLPPTYWVEALHMAAHLLNILPSSAINHDIPYTRLYKQKPNYTTLRVFGCLCYPHLHTTNKLAPRSTPCIFLGYPSNHRGYRCLDLATNRIILSRHVTFDETSFPFGSMNPTQPPSYDFLDPPPNLFSRSFHLSPSTQPSETQPPSTEATVTSPTSTETQPPPIEATVTPTETQPPPNEATVTSPTPTDTQPSIIPLTSKTQPPPTEATLASTSQSTHPMITRARLGTAKPVQRFNLHTSALSPIPRTYPAALHDPNWNKL
ncbi:uncharacterized protein [Rutidosis leptorrhynchoides]|uniref:uncharacterized protein n=1 Tax=Rutidosis leptorrhynchoides TaxID=125765 RepID=UPI003A9994FF